MYAGSSVSLYKKMTDLLSSQYLVMHRVQPSTQKGYLLVAHTAFPPSRGSKDRGFSKSFSRIMSLTLIARQLNQFASVDQVQNLFSERVLNSRKLFLFQIRSLASPRSWCTSYP